MKSVTVTEFAKLLGLAKTTVSDECKPGGRLNPFADFHPTGRVRGILNPEAALAHWKEVTDHGRAMTSKLEANEYGNEGALTRANVRLKEAQAAHAELKTQEAAGELVSVDEVRREWSSLLSHVRERLLAIPTYVKQAVPELTVDQLTVIEKQIRDALEELVEEETEVES